MISDEESDFYGDEEEAEALQSRADAFDVRGHWIKHGFDLGVAARDTAAAIHNGYEDETSARQLNETVGQFLARLPPATTRVTLDCPWIYIWNPFVPSDRKTPGRGGHDTVGGGEVAEEFIVRGQKRLDQYKAFVEKNRTPTGKISARIKKESKEFTNDILRLAGRLGVTKGKWIMYPSPEHCNDVWGKVARATANNELGIAAKISPREDPDRHRLVCVYTHDFNDKDDVARVLKRLKELGLVRQRQICYKTDAFSHLGIKKDNKLGLDVGKYQSDEIFAYLEG